MSGQEPQAQDLDQQPPAATPPATPPAAQQPVQPATPPAVQPQTEPQAGDSDLPQWAIDQRKALRDEAAANRVALREEKEKWQGGLTKAEVDALRAEHVKFVRDTVGREVGLDEQLFERIKGETPEEMRADALVLAGGRRAPQASGAGLTPSEPPGSALSPLERAKASYASGKQFVH